METDYLDALFETLLADEILMGLVKDVVDISGDQGTQYPICVVSELSSRIAYTSGGIDTEKHFFNIEAIALPQSDPPQSGRKIAQAILKRTREVLQDLDGGILTGDGEVINVRRIGSLPSAVIVENSDEMYTRLGDEWELLISQE